MFQYKILGQKATQPIGSRPVLRITEPDEKQEGSKADKAKFVEASVLCKNI